MPYPLIPLSLKQDVLGNNDYLGIILGNRSNVKSVREICELVNRYCPINSTACSEKLYEQIVVEAMGITIDKGGFTWKEWMDLWCAVVKNPQDFFDHDSLWYRDPVRLDKVESLKWARRNGLLNYPSFDAGTIVSDATTFETLPLLAYLCKTYPHRISMDRVMSCVFRILFTYIKKYADLEMRHPRSYLESRIDMLNVKQLIEIFDNHVTRVSADNRDFMNSRLFDPMLNQLQGVMNYAQPFPRYQDDLRFLRDWLDNKRQEKLDFNEEQQPDVFFV